MGGEELGNVVVYGRRGDGKCCVLCDKFYISCNYSLIILNVLIVSTFCGYNNTMKHHMRI
jgi:hypothetical protein